MLHHHPGETCRSTYTNERNGIKNPLDLNTYTHTLQDVLLKALIDQSGLLVFLNFSLSLVKGHKLKKNITDMKM